MSDETEKQTEILAKLPMELDTRIFLDKGSGGLQLKISINPPRCIIDQTEHPNEPIIETFIKSNAKEITGGFLLRGLSILLEKCAKDLVDKYFGQ